jgi:hypothetical protein
MELPTNVACLSPCPPSTEIFDLALPLSDVFCLNNDPYLLLSFLDGLFSVDLSPLSVVSLKVTIPHQRHLPQLLPFHGSIFIIKSIVTTEREEEEQNHLK